MIEYDEDQTSTALALAMVRELTKHPDMRADSIARHYPWGSEIEVSYPVGPLWLRKLWRNRIRRRFILLATGADRVIKLRRDGRPVPL